MTGGRLDTGHSWRKHEAHRTQLAQARHRDPDVQQQAQRTHNKQRVNIRESKPSDSTNTLDVMLHRDSDFALSFLHHRLDLRPQAQPLRHTSIAAQQHGTHVADHYPNISTLQSVLAPAVSVRIQSSWLLRSDCCSYIPSSPSRAAPTHTRTYQPASPIALSAQQQLDNNNTTHATAAAHTPTPSPALGFLKQTGGQQRHPD
jgi:hypothetical protein